ncbi:MAG: LPS-assembly protein LptD [Cytophagaceae bacterium]|jgi:lipopolysaccharide export system protein LptA|nr:LPS-assembly protein LptD [Cytophagaceae bacterium]
MGSGVSAWAQVDKTVIASPIVSDTIQKVDSLNLATSDSDIETTIEYSCSDSLRMDVEGKKIYLYGNAKVVYGNRSLEADRMVIHWDINEVEAFGKTDSITGKKIGTPLFKEGSDVYVADQIRYNFKSGKGIIRGIVTKQGDGFIEGDPVKKTPNAIYVQHATYTTCNLAEPHFCIRASRIKVIPNDKVVTGPFHMEFMGIPIPLGMPLGFFPITKRGKSGIIIPTFGEQRTRGFFLSQGGYYWAVNDYVGSKFVGDIYSNGSFLLSNITNYKKRYGSSGTVQGTYSKIRNGFEDTDPLQELWNIKWSHNSATNRSSTLKASVNISSSRFYSQTSYNPNLFTSGEFTSNITYTKTLRNTPFFVTVTGRQTQNVSTQLTTYTLPSVNLSMNRVYPFKTSKNNGEKWFEKINISYNGNAEYRVNNQIRGKTAAEDTILPFSRTNLPLILDNGQWGALHRIPVSTTFKLFRHISLNPSVNYEEWWYGKKLEYEKSGANSATVKDTLPGFSRAWTYSAQASLTTRIYSTYTFKSDLLKGIRHTFIPTIGYTYKPDQTTNSNYFQTFPDVLASNGERIPYSVYQGFIFGGPGGGLTNSLTVRLQNTLEGKTRNRKDTTGIGTKKIKLLESVDLSGSYNFSADSLNFSLLQFSTRTKLLERLDAAFQSTFDPYSYVLDSINGTTVYQRRVNTFELNNSGKLVNTTRYNLSLGMNLNRKGLSNAANSYLQDPNLPTTILPPGAAFVDFRIPWNLIVQYNLNVTQEGYKPKSITQAISFSGDVTLTDNWKVKFTSGYDFVRNSITSNTSITVIRDLHCWQMSLTVIPYGPRQMYFFTINAKSSILRDLKMNKRSPSYIQGF